MKVFQVDRHYLPLPLFPNAEYATQWHVRKCGRSRFILSVASSQLTELDRRSKAGMKVEILELVEERALLATHNVDLRVD